MLHEGIGLMVLVLQVKRWGELARKLRYFHDQIAKAGQTPAAYRPVIEKEVELDELEAKLGDLEAELLEINANTDKLQRSHGELTELQLVLQKVTVLICEITPTRHIIFCVIVLMF